jgi:hypothetical protein
VEAVIVFRHWRDLMRGEIGALRAAAFALFFVGSGLPLQAIGAATGSTKFIPTFLVYYGAGPALVASDAQRLAKFDLLNFDRFRYGQIAPVTWSAIKSINPDVQIYLYEMGPEDSNFHDGTPQFFLNDISRYDVSRGHSMGSLNGNHPELFLTDSGGNRLYSTAYSNPAVNRYVYLMEFGSAAYHSYWLEAVNADIVTQPWVADGVFADNCIAVHHPGFGTFSSTPANPNPGAIPAAYPDNTAWSGAMNSFAKAITVGLHGNATPQRVWCNRGETRTLEGSNAWAALDAGASPPDAVMEEGAFAVMWGPADWAVQFPKESEWKVQVDTLGGMWNSKVAALSHTKLAEPPVFSDNCGTDNWGKPVCYWQTLWYSLGSFLISKNNVLRNSYFMFHGGESDYSKIIWYDEYDKIDLGKSLGFYNWGPIDGVNVYSREFEKGYVYANPTPNDVALLNLPQPSRQLTHDNINSLPGSIPVVDAISLNSHNAAILLKTTPTTRFDQTDSSVTYTAGWMTDGTAAKRPWSEGSGAYINTAGAQVTFTFTGTSVKWIGARGPWGGIARVFLDETLVAGSVDTYAGTEKFQQDAILFSATGLPAGTHSLRIEVTGTRNSAATDTVIAVDALDVTP